MTESPPPTTLVDDPGSALQSPQPPPFAFPVVVLLIPPSLLGVLARIGLQTFASYDGRSIFPLAYVQAVGCLIMGFALGLKESFATFYSPLYIALTTGFCGSLTTFSGWQVDVFLSWLNAGQYQRHRFLDAFDGIAKTAFTLALSLVSLRFGRLLANIIKPRCSALPSPNRLIRLSLTAVSIVTFVAIFPAYFYLPRRQITAALLFAYPGTLSRYLLSVWFNSRLKGLPLGTFAANASGTALLGVLRVLQSTPTAISPNACIVLQGLSDGYCGCLTTISTFAAELDMMELSRACVYAAMSWATGQLLLLVILGSSNLTGYAEKQLTCSIQ